MGAEIGQVSRATINLTLYDMVAIDFANPHNSLRTLLLVQLIAAKFERVGVEIEKSDQGSLHIREVMDPVVLCEIDWQRGTDPADLDDRKTQKTLGKMIEKLVKERFK